MSRQDMVLRLLTALANAPEHGMTSEEMRGAIGATSHDEMVTYTSLLIEISANRDDPSCPVTWRWECETWGGAPGYEEQRAGRSARVFYRLTDVGRQALARARAH